MKRFVTIGLAIVFVICSLSGKTYYLDSKAGSNSYSGLKPDSAWQSVSKIQGRGFLPGDSLAFKRGGLYNGNLWLTLNGSPGKPIIFTSYGSGERPIASNPGDSTYQIWAINNSSYVIIENIHFRNVHEDGFEFRGTSSHDTLRDCEFDSVGIGVFIYGKNNCVTRSFIHDLHIIKNTPGGDDDYGAVGVVFSQADSCEVSHCVMERCRDVSYDYGFDGGVGETWGSVTNCRFMYNRGTACNGFFEAGGGPGDSLVNFTIAYNVSERNGDLLCMHTGGTGKFEISCKNIIVCNNTVIQNDTGNNWALMGFDGDPADRSQFVIRNNIFYFSNVSKVFSSGVITHDHNLYFAVFGTANLGLVKDVSEKTADPLFISVPGGDYHLQSSSPARDAGVVVGYDRDFDGNAVPNGNLPDIGAYEYFNAASVAANVAGYQVLVPASKGIATDILGRKIMRKQIAVNGLYLLSNGTHTVRKLTIIR